MSDVDNLPIDVATIHSALARAQSTAQIEALAEVEQLLRGHIALLLPEVQRQVEDLSPRCGDWYRGTAHLRAIRAQVRHGLGDSSTDARRQIDQLASDCRWLLTQHEAASR
ncbi:DUF6415 family natural product biosynthesis protein [Streptomyces sp. NPDC050315]|uniref:DUF6415 family natural product biosynthesis protein n=1 Tax=Streptomyces sp. NPDC050315 TaxID=3155039 RepID=UPI0034441D46